MSINPKIVLKSPTTCSYVGVLHEDEISGKDLKVSTCRGISGPLGLWASGPLVPLGLPLLISLIIIKVVVGGGAKERASLLPDEISDAGTFESCAGVFSVLESFDRAPRISFSFFTIGESFGKMLVLPVTKRIRSLCILICIIHVDQNNQVTFIVICHHLNMYICCFKIHCWCCLFVCCCVTKKQSSSIISSIEYCKLVLATQIFWHPPVQRNLLWICPKLLQCAALDNAMAAKRESKAKLEYWWKSPSGRCIQSYSRPLHFTLSSQHITHIMPIWRKNKQQPSCRLLACSSPQSDCNLSIWSWPTSDQTRRLNCLSRALPISISTNTNTQIRRHKYKYKYTNTNTNT